MRTTILWAIALLQFVSVLAAPTTESLVITTETLTPTEIATKENAPEKDVKESGTTIPKIYEMKVNTNVSNRFATTSVTSKVKNLDEKSREATFSVVLPESAYISGFVMEIDGKSYEAYVKEKEEAKKIYDDAVSTGMGAAHVEASARDSNRFTVSCNVEPQKKAVFKLKYEELLQRQNGKYEIVINIHPGQPVKDLEVDVNIQETRPLTFVKVPSLRSGNEISKNDESLDPKAQVEKINATSTNVHFKPDIEMQKKFASGLGTEVDNGLSGQFVVQYDVERDPSGGEVLVSDGYFVHFFAPSDLPPLKKQVVFVLDTSGSMWGNRIKQLKEAMNSILAELKPEDTLNIVEFNSIVRVWDVPKETVAYEEGEEPSYGYWPPNENATTPKPKKVQELPEPYKATPENIKHAQAVLSKMEANGGTDIKSALTVALKMIKDKKNEKSNQPMIIFLTDGEPTIGEQDTSKITSSINELNNGATPIFSLSFGDGADRPFLEKLSLRNLGFARHIYESADASLQLEAFYKMISSPALSNVEFKYVPSQVEKVTKTKFPLLFNGAELYTVGRVVDPGFAPGSIEGFGLDGLRVFTPKIEVPVGNLERLWAYLTLKQILKDRDAADDKKILTQNALDLALKYSFVTPVSSLVVVKPNETNAETNPEDASKTKGMYPGGFGAGGAQFAPSAGFGTFHAVILPSPLSFPRMGLSNYLSKSAPSAGSFYQSTHLVSAGGHYGGFPASNYPVRPLIVGGVSNVQDLVFETSDSVTTPAIIESTTEIEVNPLENLKLSLPWLESILQSDETLKLPKGSFKLGLNETITDNVECEKSTENAKGKCTLLKDCQVAFTKIPDVKTYEQYFCDLNKGFAGVCCPV